MIMLQRLRSVPPLLTVLLLLAVFPACKKSTVMQGGRLGRGGAVPAGEVVRKDVPLIVKAIGAVHQPASFRPQLGLKRKLRFRSPRPRTARG